MMIKSPTQPIPAAPQPLAAHVDHWSVQIAAAQRRAGRQALPGWIFLGLGLILFCLAMNLLRPHATIALPVAAASIAAAALSILLAVRARRRAAARLAGEIRETCRREGFSAGEVVRLLAGQAPGRVSDEVLAGVDRTAAALAQIRQRGEESFRLLARRPVPRLEFQVVRGAGSRVSAVILQGEHRIDEFARLAADSLANGLQVEAIAALAMVDMIYHEIAPAAPSHPIQSRQDPSHSDTAAAAHVLFSGYDLAPEMAAVAEARGLSSAAAGGSPGLAARDGAFVGACIDYIGQHAHEAAKRNRARALLALIPDAHTLPYLHGLPEGLVAQAHPGKATPPELSSEPAGAEAVLLLHKRLESAGTPEERRALILALGDTASGEAAAVVGRYLDDEDLSAAAFTALVRIGRTEPDAAIRAVEGHRGCQGKLLALQALRGDTQVVEKLAGALRLRTDFLTLLDVLEVAPLLRAPSLAAPLRELLSYRNHPRFPGDRSVSYLALKALVYSELAKP